MWTATEVTIPVTLRIANVEGQLGSVSCAKLRGLISKTACPVQSFRVCNTCVMVDLSGLWKVLTQAGTTLAPATQGNKLGSA